MDEKVDVTSSIPASRKMSDLSPEELSILNSNVGTTQEMKKKALEDNREKIIEETKKMLSDKEMNFYEFFDKLMEFDYTLLTLAELVFLKFKIEDAMRAKITKGK